MGEYTNYGDVDAEHIYDSTNRSLFRMGEDTFYVNPSTPIAFDPASDFAQGIKTGPVDNDQRLHTFFIAVDNHSGGMGYDQVSVREESGLYSHSLLGADSRRSKHLHAPPYIHKLYSCSTGLQNFVPDLNHSPDAVNVVHLSGDLCLFWPGACLRTQDGAVFQRHSLTSAAEGKLIRVFSGLNSSTMNYYALFHEGTAPGATLRAWRSTDGSTWAAESQRSLWDVYYFQGYFWGLGENGVLLSAGFPAGAGGTGLPPGPGQFIGPGNTPAGDRGLFLIKNGRLFYAVKFFNTLYGHDGDTDPTTVDDIQLQSISLLRIVDECLVLPGFNIVAGMIFNNSVLIHNGYSMLQYIVAGSQEVTRDIGFQTFRNTIPQLGNGATIRSWTNDGVNVYVAIQKGLRVYIAVWDQTGWSLLGDIPEDTYVQNIGIGWLPPTSYPTTERTLYILGSQGAGSASDDSGEGEGEGTGGGGGGGGTGSVEVLYPTANGNYTGWTGDYTDVDEVATDEASTVISSNTTNARESFTNNVGITIPGSSVIDKITISYRGLSTAVRANEDREVFPFVVIGGQIYEYDDGGTNPGIEFDPTFVTRVWTLNKSPRTGISWTETEVEALEWGIRMGPRAEDGSNSIQAKVTQTYVSVYYVPGTSSSPNRYAALSLYGMHLPALGINPSIGEDKFAQKWDLYEGWFDGGFIDLQGALYEFTADGRFSATEYVEVYYQIDNGIKGIHDSDDEHYLGTINGNNQKFYWGTLADGEEFIRFRLHFKGFSLPFDINHIHLTNEEAVVWGDHADRTALAMRLFLQSVDTKLSGVMLRVAKVDTPTDNLYVTIEGISAGVPSGVALATSAVFTKDNLETTMEWRYFKFPQPVAITANTVYHICVRRSGAVSATHHFKLGLIQLVDYFTQTVPPAPQWWDADGDGQISILDASAFSNYRTRRYDGDWGQFLQDGSGDDYEMIYYGVLDRSKTADLQSYVVSYNKRPDYRAQFQLEMDVNGMIEDKVLIGGEPATFESIYNRCIELWNHRTLVHYEKPGVRSGFCSLVSMPVVVEGHQDNVGVEGVTGTIRLQVLEITTGRPR